jgi:hypothetical protein
VPRYVFVCDPCEEHQEKINREVAMSISHFEDEGKHQICSRCNKEMRQVFQSFAIHGDLPGRGKRKLPPKDARELENSLVDHYVEKSYRDGDMDAARDLSETVVIDRYRDTKTGKKVHVPVEVPPVKD